MNDVIREIKQSWGWAGIRPMKVVGENDFGNLIIEDIEGKYWRLCPEEVYCRVIAKDRTELDIASNEPEFLEDWYMLPLVEAAREAIGALQEGYKYCLVIPGILGGAYDVSNIKTAPLVEIVGLSGDIGRQIMALPDGATVKMKVVE